MNDDDAWAPLGFEERQTAFESASQNARVWSEAWVAKNLFCPSCGADNLHKFPNNHPVADFWCDECKDEYELKSQRNRVTAKVVDGAYRTMCERLAADNNPHLVLMTYSRRELSVTNLLVVSKHFLFRTSSSQEDRWRRLLAAQVGSAAIFWSTRFPLLEGYILSVTVSWSQKNWSSGIGGERRFSKMSVSKHGVG